MASNNEAKIKFTAETSDFTQAIKDANTEISELKSEMKLADATFKNTGDAAEYQQQKLELLQQALEANHEKQEALTQKLEAAKEIYGEDSNEVKNLESSLNYAKIQEQNLLAQVNETNGALDDQSTSAEGAGSSVNDMAEMLVNAEVAGKVKEIAEAALEMAQNFDEAKAVLAEGTGASGEALDDLQKAAQGAFGEIADSGQDLADVSEITAVLNTRFGTTGDQLQADTVKMAKFSKVTGTGGKKAVKGVADVMKRWGMGMEDMDGLLDDLVTGSQSCSLSVDELTGYLTKNSTQFQELGYSQEEALAMLVSLSEGGADVGSVMSGLTKGIANLSDTTDDVPGAFRSAIDAIGKCDNVTDALQVQVGDTGKTVEQIFGKKAAQELATNVLNGSFAIEEWTAVLEDNDGQLQTTAENATTMKDKWSQAMNNMQLAVMSNLAPAISEVVKKVADVITKVAQVIQKSPVLQAIITGVAAALGVLAAALAIGSIISAVTKAFSLMNTALLANPIVLVVAAIAALAAGLVYAYKHCETFRNIVNNAFEALKSVVMPIIETVRSFVVNAFQAIREKVEEVFPKIQEIFSTVWETIKTTVTTVVSTIWENLTRAWYNIKNTAKTVWENIKTAMEEPMERAKELITTAINTISTTLTTVWYQIKNTAKTVWEGIKSAIANPIGTAKTAVTTAINGISTTFTRGFYGLKSTAKKVWEGIKTAISDPIGTAKDLVTTAVNAISTTATTVFYAIKKTASTVWNAIKTALSTPMDEAKALVTTVINAISTTLTTVWYNIKKTASTVWNAIKTVMAEPIEAAKTELSNIVTAISTTLTTIFYAIKSTASTVWNGIKMVITTAIEEAKTLVTNIINEISNVMTTVFYTIKNTATTVWNAIKAAITTPITAAKTLVTTTINGIATTMTTVWYSIKSTASTVWNNIKSAITGPIEAAKTTVTSVISSISTTVTSVFYGIKSTVSSVWEGIKSAITKPIDDAYTTLTGVLKKIKDAFANCVPKLNIKIPKVTVDGGAPPWGIMGKGRLPSFNVTWNKLGAVFDAPTIFATRLGFQGVGENGPEAVAPIDTLQGYVEEAVEAGSAEPIDYDLLAGKVAEACAKLSVTIDLDRRTLGRVIREMV